jgi:3'-5' exoribonuclease
MADRDLLLAGALLHDIGKVTELSYEGDGFDYTDEGRLVGHLVMTAQKIREKALRIEGFPPLLEQHLTHLVLAHHGQLDYGSPKVPMTIEAQIVHAIDSLDSRIASWLEQMAKEPNDTWTSPNRIVDRHLWKGPSPTTRGRAPVPPRKPRREKEKKARPERPEKPAEKREEAPKLAFKPLDQLIPQESNEAPAEPPEPKPEAS